MNAKNFPAWYSCTLDTRPLWQAVDAWAERSGCDFSEKIDVVSRRIERFKWCKEVCFDHQCWVLFDFETSRADVAAKRLAETQAKLERLRLELEGDT